MNNYQSFDQLRTNELTVARYGWLNARYEVTDGQFCYGAIQYGLFRRRHAVVETARGSWTFDKPFFSRILTISKPSGEVIGKVHQSYFDRQNQLLLNTGFTADFNRSGIFPTEFTWSSGLYGDILRTAHRHFRFTRPLTITLNPTSKLAETPLLVFLSIQIILLRHRRKAAAH
jgi:hypothetical protein